MRPIRSILFRLLMAAGPGLVLLGLVARWLPSAARPRCLTHVVTGLPCPGCGSYRALVLFTTGRWGDAFRTQPLMTLLFLAAVLASVAAWACWLAGKKEPDWREPGPVLWRWLIAAAVLALLGNWAYLVAAGI